MKIHEYQGKALLRNYGIPVPDGEVATTPEEAGAIAEKLATPVAVKAQVHVGGRGKAGGIQLAQTPDEARDAASRILGMNLKGLVVEKVLVEPVTGPRRRMSSSSAPLVAWTSRRLPRQTRRPSPAYGSIPSWACRTTR
jgi:succinyl-CoA synthetase beta subunit